MTKYKKAILELINDSTFHMTVEEVYKEVKRVMPNVALATVYNNLNSLVEDGLICRIKTESQLDRYDKIRKHDHLVCKKCGKLIDINFTDLTDLISRETNFRILGYDLRAFILCEECAQEGEY